MMFKTTEGSTGRLLQLCLGYFFFYVITGVAVKYFMGPADKGFPGMSDMEFLVYSTLGGTVICLLVALARGWYKLKSNGHIQWGRVSFPSELLYIIPSGICTAVVIPTTTLMYTLPISVMVAMIIMRGSVIVISRLVDAIQIRQGILKKKVFFEENMAVLFAVMAVGVHLLWAKPGSFDFVNNVAAMTILGCYIVAYFLRIYLMNYFKNTRAVGVQQDNKGFFAIEQIAASSTLFLAAVFIYFSPELMGWSAPQILGFKSAIDSPNALWGLAILAGTAYGIVAFFSVFLFMFKGRTATFAGLVNRLTSLIAGTAATLVGFFVLGGKFPKQEDWLSLGFILIAVAFLSVAERKRNRTSAQTSTERVLELGTSRGIAGA